MICVSLSFCILSTSAYRIVLLGFCCSIAASELVWKYKNVLLHIIGEGVLFHHLLWHVTDNKLYWFAGIQMEQLYPQNSSYSCPGGPSLILECRFPTGADVSWSCTGVTAIPDGYPGHLINNSMIHSGVSYLYVINSSALKDMYRCIVFYPNGTTQQLPRNTSSVPEGETVVTCVILNIYIA